MIDWQRLRTLRGRKGSMDECEVEVLCRYAAQYPEGVFLEIGTLLGMTAAALAMAAPQAKKIYTLTPARHEVSRATENLADFPNVHVLPLTGVEFLELTTQRFDLVFVDGDHKNAHRDKPWWDRVCPGGVMIWHDFNTYQSKPVYDVVWEIVRESGLASPTFVLEGSGSKGLAVIVKPR